LHDTERYGYGSKEENALGAGYPLRDSNVVEVQPFSPKRVEALDSMCIVSVAAGNMYTIVVTINGVVFPAGCPYLGLATVLSTLEQLQLGCSPPCCHTERRPVPDPPLGRVFSFGSGEDGMLGHGSTETQVLPKEVEALRGVDVASVCAGQSQVLALYTGGVYSWGNNDGHPLPSGGDTDMTRLPPRRIEALRGVRVRCISAGLRHSCAVTVEGEAFTWGVGSTGALGHWSFAHEWLPKRVEMFHIHRVFVVGVSAGAEHTLVADADGAVWGFGCLNALGIWNAPMVKAVREASVGSEEGSAAARRIAQAARRAAQAVTLACSERLNKTIWSRMQSTTASNSYTPEVVRAHACPCAFP
jgi:hypothetical protein